MVEKAKAMGGGTAGGEEKPEGNEGIGEGMTKAEMIDWEWGGKRDRSDIMVVLVQRETRWQRCPTVPSFIHLPSATTPSG